MAEALLIFGANEEFGTLQHLLDHDPCSSLDLHHPVVFQSQMFRCTDVQGNTAHITLMDRSHHLGHHREAHFLGKGDELVFRRAHQFWYQRNTRTFQNLTYNLWLDIAVGMDVKDDLIESGNIDAIELYLRGSRLGRAHDL